MIQRDLYSVFTRERYTNILRTRVRQGFTSLVFKAYADNEEYGSMLYYITRTFPEEQIEEIQNEFGINFDEALGIWVAARINENNEVIADGDDPYFNEISIEDLIDEFQYPRL